MKRHWKVRAIIAFLVTNMGLGGYFRSKDFPTDEMLFIYAFLAPVWFIIIYTLEGFIFKDTLNKIDKNKEKIRNIQNIQSNKIVSTNTSSKPIEKKPLNPINQNTSVEEMPTNIKTSDEEIEVSEKEKKEIWTNISITTNEEEKLYETIAIEVEKDRREGIWTKALVESDGDENKTKIQYIKLRVEILTNELKEKKFQEAISIFIKHKKRSLQLKKIVFDERARIRGFQTLEMKTGNHLADLYNVNSISKENEDKELFKSFFAENFTINIYHLNDRNDPGRKDRYYWLKGKQAKDIPIRSYWLNIELVKKDIESHFTDLINNLD